MKTLFTHNLELKAFSTILIGMAEPEKILIFISGLALGHFGSPFIRKILKKRYEREGDKRADAHREID